MNSVSFKPYDETYLPEILDIYTYYIVNSTATCQITPIDMDAMRQILEPESPRYKSFVILEDGVLCGYALFTRFKTREAYNDTAEATIYLRQGYTGKGIGGLALELIEKEAKAAGIHVLVALISSENSSSIRLFEKCGYFKCADFKECSFKFGRYFGLVCLQKII
jgi:phosphinothricin acetyltransferase